MVNQNQTKGHSRGWQVRVTKTGMAQVSDTTQLLPTKYTMPKTSSNNQISAAFEEIAETLNNPQLQERFFNGNKKDQILNEIVEIFDRKTIKRTRVSPSPNTEKIAHIPTRVNHNPKKCDQNTHKIVHIQKEPMCNQNMTSMRQHTQAKTKTNKSFTLYPRGTFIYKLFDKIYWQATIFGFNTRRRYYTVQYYDNDEEELTSEEVASYLITPKKK